MDLIVMKPSLSIAANGHVMLDFGDSDAVLFEEACAKLENDMGFVRHGRAVVGLDEGIAPSLVRADLQISSGWDNWLGCYLLADSAAGDGVLRQLCAALAQSRS